MSQNENASGSRKFSQIMVLSATPKSIVSAFLNDMPQQQTHMDDEIRSPCTDVCRINAETGWCEGCLRTIEEISEWRFSTNMEKRAILMALEVRRKTTPSTPRF